MNHLEGIQKVIKDTPSVKLVENVRKVFKEVRKPFELFEELNRDTQLLTPMII